MRKLLLSFTTTIFITTLLLQCGNNTATKKRIGGDSVNIKKLDTVTLADTFFNKLCMEAIRRTFIKETYDGSYRQLKYPNGDVPDSLGVCTDLIIRAYRKLGIDLQKLIHEDMLSNFSIYQKRRYSEKIDANIDHRRTPNMQTYFTRQGAKKVISQDPADYEPGDLVFWDAGNGHVGLVINIKSADGKRWQVAHNIGSGSHVEDFLLGAPIVDHYRWAGKKITK